MPRQAMLLGRLVSDTVDAFDRDQIILYDVYDSVLAGPQPVIVAAVEASGGYGFSANRITAALIVRIPS
jgi:hypothetical protein